MRRGVLARWGAHRDPARDDAKKVAGQTIVAVLTGHDLKDPQPAIASAPPVANDLAALEAALR